MHRSPRLRPAAHAEQTLLRAILGGRYPPGAALPAERELARRLGVTRPTLREALQRLQRDGWLLIRHGKETRINDFWRHGGLNVLGALVRHGRTLPPPGFVHDLLVVRAALAPAYARAAVEHHPGVVITHLAAAESLEDSPAALARYDWGLHQALAAASDNPIYTLILNGFTGFYEHMAERYFARPETRASSLAFYQDLLSAAGRGEADRAERVTRRAMVESARLWKRVESRGRGR